MNNQYNLFFHYFILNKIQHIDFHLFINYKIFAVNNKTQLSTPANMSSFT